MGWEMFPSQKLPHPMGISGPLAKTWVLRHRINVTTRQQQQQTDVVWSGESNSDLNWRQYTKYCTFTKILIPTASYRMSRINDNSESFNQFIVIWQLEGWIVTKQNDQRTWVNHTCERESLKHAYLCQSHLWKQSLKHTCEREFGLVWVEFNAPPDTI